MVHSGHATPCCREQNNNTIPLVITEVLLPPHAIILTLKHLMMWGGFWGGEMVPSGSVSYWFITASRDWKYYSDIRVCKLPKFLEVCLMDLILLLHICPVCHIWQFWWHPEGSRRATLAAHWDRTRSYLPLNHPNHCYCHMLYHYCNFFCSAGLPVMKLTSHHYYYGIKFINVLICTHTIF